MRDLTLTEVIAIAMLVVAIVGLIPAYITLPLKLKETNERIANLENLTAVYAQIEMLNGTNLSMRGMRIICPNGTGAAWTFHGNIAETSCTPR